MTQTFSAITIIINLMITAWNSYSSHIRNRDHDRVNDNRYLRAQRDKRNSRTVNAINDYVHRSDKINSAISSHKYTRIQIKLRVTMYFGRWSVEYLLNGEINKRMLQQCIGISAAILYRALSNDPRQKLQDNPIYKKNLGNLYSGLHKYGILN